MKRKRLLATGIAAVMSLSLPLVSHAAEQSARWIGSGDRWQVSDNAGGFIKDCWFQDDVTGHWYMLGAEDGSVMYSGLVTDQSTGKSYLLNVNHDGTFGRMLTVNGMYNINGKDVYMTFNQEHDGTFGAIISGLSEVRNTGVNERKLSKIPTDSNTGSSQSSSSSKSTSSGIVRDSNGNVIPQDFVDELRKAPGMTDDIIRESYGANKGKLGDASGIHWN